MKPFLLKLNTFIDKIFYFLYPRNIFIKKIIFLLTLTFVSIVLYFILKNNSQALQNFQYAPLFFLILILIPISITMISWQFLLSSQLLKKDIHFLDAIEVTIISTAANMLPLPGGLMVRTAALKDEKTHYSKGLWVTSLISFSWIAVIGLYSSISFLFMHYIIGWIGLIFSILLILVVIYFLLKIHVSFKIIFSIFFSQFILIGADVVGLWIIFNLMLSFHVDFLKIATLTISNVAGSIVGFVPAGLGIREGVGAFIANFIDLSPSITFITMALHRITTMIVIIPIATLITVFRKK